MIIHVVKTGDSINSIAEEYGVSADRLILDNDINHLDRLVIGETIVVRIPETTYIIQEGDTLEGIADRYGITVSELLRNNLYLSDIDYIYPGETIVISYEGDKIRAISTNSYTFPFIDMKVLRKTLPFLTYLTIFSYKVTAEGEIIEINDTEIIQEAKAYGVAPIMMVEALSQSMEEEIDVIHSILSSHEVHEKFFDNLLRILQLKGYIGVDINTPYILPEDRNLYDEFILELANRVSAAGYKIFYTFSIRIFQLLTGTIFNGLDYSGLGNNAEGITLITYDFGYSEGIPTGTISLDTFVRFFDYVSQLIPPEKIYVGLTVIGYVWKYPYVPGISRGMAVNYNSAIDIAYDNNVEIRFDETTNTAYFQFVANDEYIVRFWDARSMDVFIKLVPEFGLNGINIWNIMNWFPPLWLVVNSQYDIIKVL
ncbi:MAG TPA: LysM peptidoglycan-binding domain-containing protein [Mobilitalea sp.]|nr:LysM peptidoglycan-binding domain-containing protein [Mobilitalea sp.]